MTQKNELQEDLKNICAQTKGQWLCYDEIHSENMQADTALYVKELKHLGYSIEELLALRYLNFAYGGGLEIRHQEEAMGAGYTLNGKNNKKLVILAGFSRRKDKHTIYHEAAHLYQFEYNMFNVRYRGEYETYLSETHANAFAAMVLLLKSPNILEYKKQKLSLFAGAVDTVNDKRKKMLYYLSLPIELELIKQIRRQGRKNVCDKFSKKGRLDFKKIAFWTADLVRKYGFSREEFSDIQKGKAVLSYELLKRKAKAYRILGKAFQYYERQQRKAQDKYHDKIDGIRIEKIKEKLEPLPSNNKEAEIINSVCALDNFQVKLCEKYGLFDALVCVTQADVCQIPDKFKRDVKAIEDIVQTVEKMKTIYQKWQQEPYFHDLVSKLLFVNQRDEVWQLKEQKKKQIAQKNFEFGLSNKR